MDPGTSLFNGGTDQLQLHASSQNREEEEEALEDQKRREQELENLLVTAFDDLEDDDEDNDLSTINSSHHNNIPGKSNSNSSCESATNIYSYGDVQNHAESVPASFNEFGNNVYADSNNDLGASAYEHNIYMPDGNNMRHNGTNGYRTDSGGHRPISLNNYVHDYDNQSHNHKFNAQEADNFGYLSTIHQMEYSNGDKNRPYNVSPTPEDIYRHSELNSQEQLMVLYGARMQEISRLTKELTNLRLERDKEVEQLKRKVLLLEAEKQGAFLSHKEAQNLLVDQRSSLSKLHHEIEELRQSNISLKMSNEELAKELEVTRASAADLMKKVTLLDRKGSGLQSEKHVEAFLKTVNQKHEDQLHELQSQIDNFSKKLSQKDCECSTLEQKLRDALRAQEALMVEKGNIINELNRQLEEAQQRVREYANSADGQENIRLKVQLEEARNERKALEDRVVLLSSKLESVERDLQQYESVSKMGLFGNGDSSFETDSIALLGMSRRHSHGERSTENGKDSTKHSSHTVRDRDDLHSKLREELHRALQGQRSKRGEIRKLQEELSTRDRIIKTMKEQEKVYFEEAENFKKNLSAVLERLKRQEEGEVLFKRQSEELSAVRAQLLKLREERDELETELKDTKLQLENVKSECGMLHKQLSSVELKYEQSKVNHMDQATSEFLAFHDESLARLRQESSRHLEAQVIDFRVRMEQAQKECEELKHLYIEVCSAKRALLTQLQEEEARAKKLTSDLEDAKEAQQSLEELHRQERELTRRLRADLEREREKSSRFSNDIEQKIEEKVKDRVHALQKEQENRVSDLEKARDEALSRAENLQKKVLSLEQDSQLLQQLREECAQLRSEAIEGPRKQQAEVERVSRELKQSRERVLQLEKRLRAEFQTQMDAMIAERDLIQSQLKQKDSQLEEYLEALSRIRPATREAFTNTNPENSNSIDTLRRHFEEQVRKLETQRIAGEKQRLAALEAQYKAAIASTEERVKEQTVRYFAEEIAGLEEKHRNELGTFAKKLVDVETIKNALEIKTQEVENLSQKLKSFEGKGTQFVSGSEDIVKLRGFVKYLQEQMESDRNKMADAMSKWAAEVKELQERESVMELELEQLRTKYKHAKKVALHYRKLSAEKEKQMKGECHRIEAGYREALNQVQAKVGDIVGGREQEVLDHLQRIESHYEAQIKELTNKLNQKVIIS